MDGRKHRKTTSDMINTWQRIAYKNTPIYIRPETPDWFVPDPSADQLLQDLLNNRRAESLKTDPRIIPLLKRIDGTAKPGYQSRSDKLRLDRLKECWIHITNKCNMNCAHCMFSSSKEANTALTPRECINVLQEAYDLGCRIFFFTGGEPFVSTAFWEALDHLFQRPDTHVVVLTNLALISKAKDKLSVFPKDRLHFQVSLDGLTSTHDALRGKNAFNHLSENLDSLRNIGFPATLSTTVTCHNVHEMAGIIDFAHEHRVTNVHFLWLFKKGNADAKLFVSPELIFPHLISAQKRAEKSGVKIDNIESLRSQVLSCPGTRYDLSNAAWQSLAIGPDGHIYPTPALVFTDKMKCGHINEGLKNVWKKSRVMNTVRRASLNNSKAYADNPLRYLIGGGDIDHSYIHSNQITGGDPYVNLYSDIAKWLITQEAARYTPANTHPSIRLKMGEKLGNCPSDGDTIFFTHSNCVLTLPGHDRHTQVNRFYSEAAVDIKNDILNPICYDESLIRHIPEEMRFRSYGCGSPIVEAKIKKGETVVDLGSGTGIECFIAGMQTGPDGKVVGIDMGDTMLGIANKTKQHVIDNLGYDNIAFRKAFLEDLPLENASVDVILSNCVVNLSPDKRRVFQEMFRVLKPNGRIVISDITYAGDIPLTVKYNETLRGECIGGALSYTDLFGLLNDTGFSRSKTINGYHYRNVQGFDFYSITYQATKPPEAQLPDLYDFPDFHRLMESVKNEQSCACACFSAPEPTPAISIPINQPYKTGCLVCGSELSYLETDQSLTCHYCGEVKTGNAMCNQNHFVCDRCHGSDIADIIKNVCLNSRECDPGQLMQHIRTHPHFPMHGPEHHALVPAIILTALRNSGESITDDQILTAIQRGTTIAGGACAFLGVCGAAIGVGIAFSILLNATPLKAEARQSVQRITQQVLKAISSHNAPRCCQRDSWIGLQIASEVYNELRGKEILTLKPIVCRQISKNKECILDRCPIWNGKRDMH